MRKAIAMVALLSAAASAQKSEPFAWAGWTWLNGNSRQSTSWFDSKSFTAEVRIDVNYVAAFNRPRDHTLVGTSELGRTSEVQLQQLGVGGDLHVGAVRARVMTQFGLYSTMTPRNDPSTSRGQWDMGNAYRY